MTRTALFLLGFLLHTGAHAQYYRCRIVSANSGAAIPNVAVSGLQSETVWLSDSMGMVQIPADDPGPFRFSHLSFQSRILRPDSAVRYWELRLSPLQYSLDGVEVLSPLARFRRDSAFNHSFFRKELAGAAFRPGKRLVWVRTWRGVEAGIEWSGIFSNLAMVASGNKARYRRFARELRRFESSKYSAIRYTTTLVGEQTGLAEDAAMAFIAAHPIDEDFLRNASELELKMRVREMYRGGR